MDLKKIKKLESIYDRVSAINGLLDTINNEDKAKSLLNEYISSETPVKEIVHYSLYCVDKNYRKILDWMLNDHLFINCYCDHLYSRAGDDSMKNYLLTHNNAVYSSKLLVQMVCNKLDQDFIKCVENPNTFHLISLYKYTMMHYLQNDKRNEIIVLINTLCEIKKPDDPLMEKGESGYVEVDPDVAEAIFLNSNTLHLSQNCENLSDNQIIQLVQSEPLLFKFIGNSAISRGCLSDDQDVIPSANIKLWMELAQEALFNDGMALKFVIEQYNDLVKADHEKIIPPEFIDDMIIIALKNTGQALQYVTKQTKAHINIIKNQKGGIYLVYANDIN